MSITKPYVEDAKNPLAAAKAYIALIGSLATGLLASGLLGLIDNDGTLLRILTGVVAVATAVATYQFPNAEVAPIGADPEEGYDDGFDPADATPDEDVPYEGVEYVEVTEEGLGADGETYMEEFPVGRSDLDEVSGNPDEYEDERQVYASERADAEPDTPMWGDHLRSGAPVHED